jgi:hypothetical protein
LSSNHFTHFLSDGKKIKVEIYLRRLKVIRTVDWLCNQTISQKH